MSNPEIIEIKELDINSLRPNNFSIEKDLGGSKITIIGKPGSGKSVLIKYLLYSKRHIIPTGIVFSGTEDSNQFYEKMFNKIFIFDSFNKTALEDFIRRQKLAKKNFPPSYNPWAVLIMDDCMDDVSIFNDPLLVGFFKNSRHWNILSIFANQYVFDFKPVIRTNIDGVFIFREPSHANREKIYKNFASIIPSYKLFCKLLDSLTSDYTCLFINNQVQTNVWTDCVFYFKADLVPDFKFGCDEYIEFGETRQHDNS